MIAITKRIMANKMLKLLLQQNIKEKILDVGSGDGYFAKKAREKGYDGVCKCYKKK
jgi:16S rRNA G1207 methylase RsmC